MRSLLLFGGVIFALLFAANVYAENEAEQRIEDGVRAAFKGKAAPDAEIGGGVFLLQLIRSRLDEVEIRIPRLVKAGVDVEDITLTLSDVDFELSSLLEGSGDLQIGSGGGTGTLSADALESAFAKQNVDVGVSIEGANVTVSSRGREAPVKELMIDGRSLTLAAPPLERLALELPPPPRGFRYESVKVVENGLSLRLSAQKTLSL